MKGVAKTLGDQIQTNLWYFPGTLHQGWSLLYIPKLLPCETSVIYWLNSCWSNSRRMSGWLWGRAGQLYCRFGWWAGNLYSTAESNQPLPLTKTQNKEKCDDNVRSKFTKKQQQIPDWVVVPLVSSQKPGAWPRYLNVEMLEPSPTLISAKWMRMHWNRI